MRATILLLGFLLWLGWEGVQTIDRLFDQIPAATIELREVTR